MCLKHSETKQTETPEFGAEKGLLQGQERRASGRWLMFKNPTLPNGIWGEVFAGKIWGKGYQVCGFLWIGWWWGNRAVFQKSCAQPEVAMLSLKLTSSTRMGALVPAEELKDIVIYIPWEGTRTLPQGCTIVSWLTSVSAFPAFPD